MNIGMLLEMTADAAGDRLAVGSTNGGMTYGTLVRRARGLAVALAGRGVECLGLVDLNSDAVPICLFGAALAGVPFAPVNYRLPDDQLRAILVQLAPAVVATGSGVAERVGELDGIELIPTADLIEATEEADPAELPFVDPDEAAVLLFTSGTTGEPKAAVLRHRHLSSYVLGSVEFLGSGDDEAQLVSVPPYHVAGVSTVLSAAFSGRRIFYLPAFEPEEWVNAVTSERVSQAMVVPTMLGRVLDVVDATGEMLPSLRHLSYGGGRMPVELVRRALVTLPHVSFVNAYGLTETSSTVSVLGPEDHLEAFASTDPAIQARLGSVGRPLPSIEVEIRDAEGGPLAAGERGEVCIRGEQVSGEYQGRSALDENDWFCTNDSGWLDADGYLYLDGRLDDVIVRGGENLSPGEIENVLRLHPSVIDVAVVGLPDLEWGEAVAAAVVLAGGADATVGELQDWVRTRLRSTKTPERIEFRSELPYNETGKLLRRVLRSELSP